MLRLFHQRVNVDAVEPAAPARSPSSAKRSTQQAGMDAAVAAKLEPGAYVPMALPNVSYDDFTAALTPREDDSGHSKNTSATTTPMGGGMSRRPLMGLLPGWTAARRSRGPSLNASHESVPGGIPLTVDRSRHRRTESPSQRVVTSGERIASLSAERRGLRSSPTARRASTRSSEAGRRIGAVSSSVPRSPSNVPLDATSQMLLLNDDDVSGTPRRSGHAVTPPSSATVIRPHVTSAAALRAHNGGLRRTAATTPNTTANVTGHSSWADPHPAEGHRGGAVTQDDHSPEPHPHDDASFDEGGAERSMATPPQHRVASGQVHHQHRLPLVDDVSHPTSAGPSSRQASRRPSVSMARGDGGSALHSHRASAARGAGHQYDALTALVQGLRVRAKMQSKFATAIFGQIMEARSWIDELERGADLPFSAPALWQQISVWRGQLKNYALSDVAVPISFASLRAEFLKRHHQHHKRSSAGGGGGRRSRSSRSKGAEGDAEGSLERQDTAAPADDGDRASTAASANDDGKADGSESSATTPSPPKPRRQIKMLRRGAGLRRFYGDAKPPQPDEPPAAHHADPAVVGGGGGGDAVGVGGTSPQADKDVQLQETGLTGAARLAALAAPKRKTQPHHAALSHRSPSAGAAAPPHRTHAAHVAAASPPGRSGSSTARGAAPGGADASPPQRRASSLPSRPPQRDGDPGGSPQNQHAALGTPPLARHSDRASAEDRRREERRMAAAMAVPLDPELTALLAPSTGYEPWRLEHALRRPGGASPSRKQPPAGLFTSASAARELLAPFASSGRDFNRLIDNLTGLL